MLHQNNSLASLSIDRTNLKISNAWVSCSRLAHISWTSTCHATLRAQSKPRTVPENHEHQRRTIWNPPLLRAIGSNDETGARLSNIRYVDDYTGMVWVASFWWVRSVLLSWGMPTALLCMDHQLSKSIKTTWPNLNSIRHFYYLQEPMPTVPSTQTTKAKQTQAATITS